MRNRTDDRDRLLRSQEASLGAAKGLDSSVRGDKMLINETEWPPMVAGRRSYGKCRSRGDTDAKNDPFDSTGIPDIQNGAQYAKTYEIGGPTGNPHDCGCH